MEQGPGETISHSPNSSLSKKYCLDEECCSTVSGKKPLSSNWLRNISFQFWSQSLKKGVGCHFQLKKIPHVNPLEAQA